MNGLIIDLFAGGGGASAGIEAAVGRPVDYAVNHDPVALAVHKANHPHTVHDEAGPEVLDVRLLGSGVGPLQPPRWLPAP